VTSGVPVSSLTMSCTFLPATVSPFCAMYSLAAASTCLPVEAKGPVIGRIRPILKASCARTMPLADTRKAARGAWIHVLLSMQVSFESVSVHTVPSSGKGEKPCCSRAKAGSGYSTCSPARPNILLSLPIQRQDSVMMRLPARYDHVGSFLRPKYLLEAREQKARGDITAEQLRAVEDKAITEIVKFQEDVGLKSITDGEFRRTYFHIDFLEQLGGVKTDI